MLTNKLKIEHYDKKFTLEQVTEEAFLVIIYERSGETISFQFSVSELALLRNDCSRFLDNYRRLKREREKRTGQGEVNLDR